MKQPSARDDDARATYSTKREAVEALRKLAGWPDAHPEHIDSGGRGPNYWVLCVSHRDGNPHHLYADGFVR